jgi:teichoic acid transport system permease protein
MLLYWFVFQVGLRAGNVSEYPFILFLMSGMIPWFYFSEALAGGTNSLIEYSYLVKKVVFDVDILPVLKVVSSLFVHVFFTAFIIVVCACYGYTPDLYTLQLIYYIPCMCFLVMGLTYITSACTVFFRDMSQIVNIALTVGVWITPIMWNPESALSAVWQTVFRLNPLYYIVDGFRDALLAKVWFWDKPIWTIYFWIVSVMIYLLGIKMFNRLKVHFSDVL